jgi:hypothetical protein
MNGDTNFPFDPCMQCFYCKLIHFLLGKIDNFFWFYCRKSLRRREEQSVVCASFNLSESHRISYQPDTRQYVASSSARSAKGRERCHLLRGATWRRRSKALNKRRVQNVKFSWCPWLGCHDAMFDNLHVTLIVNLLLHRVQASLDCNSLLGHAMFGKVQKW